MAALGDSVFNYEEYPPLRFLHYSEQINIILKYRCRQILEIGPGDHTVTDFLRRKGLQVETYDADPLLKPDYLGNIREPLRTSKLYDCILASEVLEHSKFERFGPIIAGFRKNLTPQGMLIISLPFSTVRLFPPHSKYGRIISPEGLIPTGIPIRYFLYLTHPARVLKRRFLQKKSWKEALRIETIPDFADERFDVHHWDLGHYPTTFKKVRKICEKYYQVLEVRSHLATNSGFFILRKKLGSTN